MPGRIRVLIVDDSAVIRTVISRTLSAQADIEVVGTAVNGELGVKSVRQLNPDVVILDIEMPIMDGITALPLILKEKPGVRVLVCSTLSARGADISIRALSLGAADCILKPGGEAIVTAHDFADNLVRTVRSLVTPKAPAALVGQQRKAPINLIRDTSVFFPKILAIGSSTGGPKALMDLLVHLKNLPVPIVITQHMPKTFTAMLAQHISQHCGLPCVEGKEGTVIKPGCAYVAPGGYHMVFKRAGNDVLIHINEDPPENFCRPSVNPMIRSLSTVYAGKVLAVILTGMGNDGSQACADLVKQGGRVIAQDEATSVVWGMPGAVANAGICSAVLPLPVIPEAIQRSLKGQAA